MSEKLEQLGIKDSERTPCEIWTRVMGYHRPISSFNIGKQGEVAERKYFSEKKSCFDNLCPVRFNKTSFTISLLSSLSSCAFRNSTILGI